MTRTRQSGQEACAEVGAWKIYEKVKSARDALVQLNPCCYSTLAGGASYSTFKTLIKCHREYSMVKRCLSQVFATSPSPRV